jgi:hypothetical protein
MIAEKELMLQLSKGDVAEIFGVVDVDGIVGGRATYGKEVLCTLRFTFAAWKHNNGTIQGGKLTIRKFSNDDEIRLVKQKVSPYDVICVRARFAEQTVFPKPQALLVEIIGKKSSDAELNNIARKLQEPILIEDVKFGTFTFDPKLEWYRAKVSWGSNQIGLDFEMTDPDNQEEFKQLLTKANLLWDLQESWNERIANYAAANFLDVLNENWLHEDEQELNAEEFKNTIKLESIGLRSNGNFDFWYEDGGLFGGHAIMISGHLADGPKHAGLEG